MSFEWVDEVRQRVDIVEVISDYTDLKKSGRTWRGACPIHGGKNKSNFSVDPSRGIYRCYSDCGEGGDVFKFLMKVTGEKFMAVARSLAERYGVYIPEIQPRRLSAEEQGRVLASRSLTDQAQSVSWAEWGIQDAVSTLELGARPSDPGVLLVPIDGAGESIAPGGWLAYRMDVRGVPKPLGLDPETRKEDFKGGLFLPQGALGYVAPHGSIAYADSQLLLFVPDAITAVRIWETGYRGVFSRVRAESGDEDPWLNAAEVADLKRRAGGRALERIGLVVPALDADSQVQARLQRVLFATEEVLLAAGIESLWVRIPDVGSDPTHGWSWASRLQGPDRVQESVAKSTVSIFEWRVVKLRRNLEAEAISPNQAIEKLLSPLRAARESSLLLYESYVAWASAKLGLNSVRVMARVDGVPMGSDGEPF